MKEFRIIETILYAGKYVYLQPHLQRMSKSAKYFGFRFDASYLLTELEAASPAAESGDYKVRTLLSRSGEVEITCEETGQAPDRPAVTVSPVRTRSSDEFLYHKTTMRRLYDQQLAKARIAGYFDVLFMNEKRELTEGAITNVFIQKENVIYTPPVSCGLLDGIIRQAAIKERDVRQKIMTVRDLVDAECVYVSNSILGFRKALLDAQTAWDIYTCETDYDSSGIYSGGKLSG